MTTTKLKAGVASLLVLAGVSTLLWRQQNTIRPLEAENESLKQRAAQWEVWEGERQAKPKAEASELERLRKDQTELLRLRGEVAVLRRQMKQAAAPPPQQNPDPAVASEEQASPVNTFVAKAKANVGEGQTLVTGGWPTGPGKRALFLVTPQVAAASTERAPRQITFSTVVFEAADDILASLGMDSFKAESKESSLQGVLTASESEALLKALKSTPGVDVLSAPRVTTSDGRQAQVQATQMKMVPGSPEPIAFGPSIDLLPRLSEDHQSVEVTVQARLNLPNQPAPQP